MILKTEKLELRGIASKTSAKTGNAYKVANMESVSTGEPFEVYLGDGLKFGSLMTAKKGDLFHLTFNLNKYKNLDLLKAERVNG